MRAEDEKNFPPNPDGPEERVKARSAVFKKQLGLTDLVLTQILIIVGLPWLGVAAKLGHAHLLFWLAAIVIFYVPQAVVVIYLNRLMPLEGGPYQWAKLSFGPLAGFIVGWNLWLSTVVLNSMTGISVATYLSYALGPDAGWLAESKWFITVLNVIILSALVLITTRGLGVSKWVHNVGSIAIMIILGTLLVLPFVSLAGGTAADYRPFTASLPPLTLLSLNIFGKLSFAALFGFDGVAILAGECRSPARAISRSVVIAAPVIALIYILGTASVLAFVRPDEVDLIGPVAQALSVGLGPFGLGAHIASAVILLLLVRELALTSFIFTTNTRLPMVAGWDNLLPAWFTKLHEKHKTPVNSIYFIGAVMLALGFAGLAGVGQQEAFQLLLNTALIFYALTYLALFAIPLFGRRRAVRRPPLWLKVAAVAGLLATVNFVLLSIFPIIEVESWAAFSIKIIFIILTANVAGAALFLFAGNKWRWRGVAPAAEEATHAARQR